MDPEGLKLLILAVVAAAFLFEIILDWLNVNRKVKEVPARLANYLSSICQQS